MLRTVAFFFGLALVAAQAEVVLNYSDSGWFRHDGLHDSSNTTYIAGRSGASFYRNFFVFDLSVLPAGTIVESAVLRLDTVDVTSPTDWAKAYSLYEVTTPVSDLGASWSARVDIYDDLGSGTVFGSRLYTEADQNLIRDIALNANAVAALNAAAGGHFAIGGGQHSFSFAPGDEYIFGASLNQTRQLILTTSSVNSVPEPASIVLFATVGLFVSMRIASPIRGNRVRRREDGRSCVGRAS